MAASAAGTERLAAADEGDRIVAAYKAKLREKANTWNRFKTFMLFMQRGTGGGAQGGRRRRRRAGSQKNKPMCNRSGARGLCVAMGHADPQALI